MESDAGISEEVTLDHPLDQPQSELIAYPNLLFHHFTGSDKSRRIQNQTARRKEIQL
jgi:hypothetical protein